MQTQNLKENIKRFLKRRSKEQEENKLLKDLPQTPLPPFTASHIILLDRLRVLKILVVLFGAVAVGSLAMYGLERKNKDIILVPTLPDVMRLRAGTIPDEFVYAFAEHVASNLGTFSYRSMERQYKDLAEFMAPELKFRFLNQSEKQFQVFQDLRVDEIFEFERAKKFTIQKNGRYLVEINGHTKKYIEGNLRETLAEKFIIEFRPTAITQKRPWLLQIESFIRTTPEEEDKRKRAESIEQQQKESSK